MAPRPPRSVRRAVEHFVEGNHVALLRNGAEAFPAMLAAIESARHQVLLEMYWFASDRIGRRFAEALAAAAARGVEVAVVYDSIGSLGADPEMFEEIRRAGASVREYNPVVPWRRRFRLDRLTVRDHRKMLIVDASIGFTGGINIGDEWVPESDDGGGWRDDMVRLEGPAVGGLVDCFSNVWSRQGGAPLRRFPPGAAGRSGSGRVRVLGEAYFRNRRDIVRAYLKNMWSAVRRIWISNSYFVPDPAVTRALMAAADRGVDVRVLQPAVSDVPIVRYASRAMWSRLMKRGVRIFEWHTNVLHAKTAVIDGRWGTIGTFNLDHLSVFSNLEVNVSVRDEGFAGEMERSYRSDIDSSVEVDAHDFRFRSLGDRLLEAIAYRFRKLL